MSLHGFTGRWRSSPMHGVVKKEVAPARQGSSSVALGKPTPPRAPPTPAYQQTLKAFASFTRIAQGFPPAPRAASQAAPATPAAQPPKAQHDDAAKEVALTKLARFAEELGEFAGRLPKGGEPLEGQPKDVEPVDSSATLTQVRILMELAAKELRTARENGAVDTDLNPRVPHVKNCIEALLAAMPTALETEALTPLKSMVEAMKALGIESNAVVTALDKRSAKDRLEAGRCIAEACTSLTEEPPNYKDMLSSLDKAMAHRTNSATASRLCQDAEGRMASTPPTFDAGALHQALSNMSGPELAGLDTLFHGKLRNMEKALALAGKHETTALLGQMRDAVKKAVLEKGMGSKPMPPTAGSVGKLLYPALEALQHAVPFQVAKTGDVHKGNVSWNAQKALASHLEALQKKAVQVHVDAAGSGMSQEMWDDMGRPNCSYRIQPHAGPATALAPRARSSGHLSEVDGGEKSLRLAVSRFANHDAVRDCVRKLLDSEDNPIRLPDGTRGKFSGADASYGFTLGRAADGRVTVRCEYLLRNISGFQGPDGAGAAKDGFVHLDPASSHARFTYEVTIGADGSAELTRPLACEFRATRSTWQRDYPKPQGIADFLSPTASEKMLAAFRLASLTQDDANRVKGVKGEGTHRGLLGFQAAHAEFERNPTLAHARNLQRLYTPHEIGMDKGVWEGLGKALNGRDAAGLSREQLLAFLQPARGRVNELLQQRLDSFVAQPPIQP